MHARYYDPATGHFISPDTLVPEPARLLVVSRPMRARGGNVRLGGPGGHGAAVSADCGCGVSVGILLERVCKTDNRRRLGADGGFVFSGEGTQGAATR
jgi:hypothetical protein